MKTFVLLTGSILAFLCSTASNAQCEMNESGYANISGEYVCTTYCPGGGVGKTTYIIQNGGALSLVNEGGQTSSGTISLNKVTATGWGITATVANNCREIIFSNSTVWLRRY